MTEQLALFTPAVDTVLHGPALDVLRTLPSESVHCCVTSPPYWGLRAYGTVPQVWDGEPGCEHQWGAPVPSAGYRSNDEKPGKIQSVATHARSQRLTEFCTKCPAWRGELGLEPTPEMFVAHLVQIFREVRRVLRKDGSLWLNMGDSYFATGAKQKDTGKASYSETSWPQNRPSRHTILKPKDLCGIPWRVALALQEDGWWLRSDCIWSKPNPMPESVKGRPTRSHEYIFLLTRSRRYYYDQLAMSEPAAQPGRKKRLYGKKAKGLKPSPADPMFRAGGCQLYREIAIGERRNRRTVWTVKPQGFKGAHFATFPPRLIEPCVLGSCPPGGVVLDPFFGSGTVGVVAWQHGRHYLGIELQPAYIEIARERLAAAERERQEATA